MDLELSDEQRELRSAAGGLLDRYAPLTLARRYLEGTGDTTELWRQMAALGWFGVGLEVNDPFGVPGLCLLHEQLGRRAAPHTLGDVAVIARAALGGGPVIGSWLERIVDGSTTASLALLEPESAWDVRTIDTRALPDGDHVRLQGIKVGVHHGRVADLLGVIAVLDGRAVLVLVPAGTRGVEISDQDGIDPTCAPARVTLDDVNVAADNVVHGPSAAAALDYALQVGALTAAAEGLAASSDALDKAIAYSLEREQYGRPIAGFQALRHHIAEAHQVRETALSSVFYAAAALEERLDDVTRAVTVAKAHAAAAARHVAEAALQVFGGVGFTREHDFHLLYRRVLECECRFGDAAAFERRISDQLFVDPLALTARQA